LTDSGSIFPVSSATSAKTTFAPNIFAIAAVATNVNGVVIENGAEIKEN
jgi:hypothetical protein